MVGESVVPDCDLLFSCSVNARLTTWFISVGETVVPDYDLFCSLSRSGTRCAIFVWENGVPVCA